MAAAAPSSTASSFMASSCNNNRPTETSGLRRRRLRHLKGLGLTISLPPRSSRQCRRSTVRDLASSSSNESLATASSSSPPITVTPILSTVHPPKSPEACMTRILYSNPQPPPISRRSASTTSTSSSSFVGQASLNSNGNDEDSNGDGKTTITTTNPTINDAISAVTSGSTGSSSNSLQDLLLHMRERKRRRLRLSQAIDLRRLTVHGPEALSTPMSLEDHPEHTCSICLDVLTHPISLKACSHLFCRLCIFEMIQTCLQTGQYAPCCPLCRTEIERMSDIVKEKALAERIYALFPEQVMAKVNSTHSLEKQKCLAANIKALAEMIFEAVEGQMMMSSSSSSSDDEVIEGQGGRRGTRSASFSRQRRLRGRRGDLLQDGGLWLTGRGGGGGSGGMLDDEEEDFLLLTVELICLAYSVLLFLFLVWLRMSTYLSS